MEQKLLKQYQQTGDIKPKHQGGNSPPKVQGADLVTLTEIIENNNDATLEELCELLKDQTGIRKKSQREKTAKTRQKYLNYQCLVSAKSSSFH